MLLLEKEFDFFLNNQADLVKKYRGKILVIKNHTILGVYDDILSAFFNTIKKEEPGTFLIQKCEYGNSAYTQYYYSGINIK